MQASATIQKHPFASRESQLKKLDLFLKGMHISDVNHCVMLYGPNGVGKTRLLREFRRTLADAPFPVVLINIDARQLENEKPTLVHTMVRNVETHWPELEPYVVAFRELATNPVEEENTSESEPETDEKGIRTFQDFFDALDDYFLQSKERESKPELDDLKLCFVIDSIDSCSDEALDSFRQMKREIMDDERFASRHFFMISGESKSDSEERIQNVFTGRAVTNEILVAPFSKSESSVLLDMLGIDSSKFDQIHKESGGLPERLIELAEKHKIVSPENVAKLAVAEDLLYGMDNEQQEWFKVASLIDKCDSESLGLFLSTDQQDRASKWLKLGVVSGVDNQGDFPVVKEREKKSMMAYMERENSGKLAKRLKSVEQLESIRRVIPRLEHRQLLSLLQEFNYFDRGILVHLFGEKHANVCINLVETKVLYFSSTEQGYRLSRQTGFLMTLYNQLFPVKNLSEIRNKAKVFWAKKTSSYKKEIEEAEKQISGNEKIQKEVKSGIEDLDQKISKITHALAKMKNDNRRMVVQIRRSGVSYLAITCQIMGIIALYFGILFKEHVVMPVLFAAGLLITFGVALSFKKYGNVKIRQHEIISHSKKRSDTVKEVERMKSAKLQLATRRDQCKNKLRECREKIEHLRASMKQPYMKA